MHAKGGSYLAIKRRENRVQEKPGDQWRQVVSWTNQ